MPHPDLVAALAQLPESLRLTVYYVAVVRLSCHEVAAVMGIPQGTVMSRMYRSRLHLRQILGTRQAVAAVG
jgi:RNA polymerase sigma-70 factor (ECF subfamily)